MVEILGKMIDGQPGITTFWELLIFAVGTASTFAAFLVLVWRLIRPHVTRYVESVVRPLMHGLNVVKEEVKPNSGESLHDRARQAHRAADSADRKLDALTAAVRMVDGKLDSHVRESREYLEVAKTAFEAQGIALPDPDAVEGYDADHEESERSRRARGR